jgi:hypothetical protein
MPTLRRRLFIKGDIDTIRIFREKRVVFAVNPLAAPIVRGFEQLFPPRQ